MVASVELRRFVRDRSNIFFVLVLPLLIVVLLGGQLGESAPQGRVGVAGAESDLRTAVVAELEGLDVTFAEPDVVREQLARGRADVGLFIPDEAARAYPAGRSLQLEVVVGTQATAVGTLHRLRAAVQAVDAERAQVAALMAAGIGEADARTALAEAGEQVTAPSIRIVDVGDVVQEFAGMGPFDLAASTQTLLFVFLTSLTGATSLIWSRRHGVIARGLSAPVSAGQLVGGQALWRVVVAFGQGLSIMAGTALLFGVSWGNLALSALVVGVFAVVSAGLAMVVGSAVDSDAAAVGLGIGGGLVLAALGGCMVPLELFPDTMRTVAMATPHAWAYLALAAVQRHDAGLVDILPQLGVLAAMAAGTLTIGAILLRRSLARAS